MLMLWRGENEMCTHVPSRLGPGEASLARTMQFGGQLPNTSGSSLDVIMHNGTLTPFPFTKTIYISRPTH